MQYYKDLLEEYKEYDDEQAIRKLRIDGGLKGVYTVRITYHYFNGKTNSGFAIEYYQMPFDKEKMNNDIKQWEELRIEQLNKKNKERLQESYVFANGYTKEKL